MDCRPQSQALGRELVKPALEGLWRPGGERLRQSGCLSPEKSFRRRRSSEHCAGRNRLQLSSATNFPGQQKQAPRERRARTCTRLPAGLETCDGKEGGESTQPPSAAWPEGRASEQLWVVPREPAAAPPRSDACTGRHCRHPARRRAKERDVRRRCALSCCASDVGTVPRTGTLKAGAAFRKQARKRSKNALDACTYPHVAQLRAMVTRFSERISTRCNHPTVQEEKSEKTRRQRCVSNY